MNNVKFNIMKVIEITKFICGLTLVSFAILAGLIFYLESFEIFDTTLSAKNQSSIFRVFIQGGGAVPSNTLIFLGLCSLAGAYLLASVKLVKTESKTEITSNKPEKEV